MKKIRQGHSRFRLEVVCGSDGLADLVYVYHCVAMKVRQFSVEYFDGHDRRLTSHWAWLQMYPTRRKAWAAALKMVYTTDSIRGAEYVKAWKET